MIYSNSTTFSLDLYFFPRKDRPFRYSNGPVACHLLSHNSCAPNQSPYSVCAPNQSPYSVCECEKEDLTNRSNCMYSVVCG